mgnify:CR=1 FL=1
MNKILTFVLISATLLTSCDNSKPAKTDTTASSSVKAESIKSNSPADILSSYKSIDQQQLIEHIKVLSSDEFEGRAPSSKGEKLTLNYLKIKLYLLFKKKEVYKKVL